MPRWSWVWTRSHVQVFIMWIIIIMCKLTASTNCDSQHYCHHLWHSKWLKIADIVTVTISTSITMTTSITVTTFDRDFECLPRPCKPSPCGCGGCTGRNIRLIINIPISTISSNCEWQCNNNNNNNAITKPRWLEPLVPHRPDRRQHAWGRAKPFWGEN